MGIACQWVAPGALALPEKKHIGRGPLSAAAMDREGAGDVDASALRRQRAESLQRRKLGQRASAAEMPKKSGYLLKKGPLKVTPDITCAGGDMSAQGIRRHRAYWMCLLLCTVAQVWQKRWFVLEQGELSYFRSHQQVGMATTAPQTHAELVGMLAAHA